MAGHRYSDGRWQTTDSHGGDGYQPDGTVDQQLVAPASSSVPSGSATAVLEWVAGDAARAAAALDVELRRAKPRQRVLTAVDQLLDRTS